MSGRPPFCSGPCAGGSRPCPARLACHLDEPGFQSPRARVRGRAMVGSLILLAVVCIAFALSIFEALLQWIAS